MKQKDIIVLDKTTLSKNLNNSLLKTSSHENTKLNKCSICGKRFKGMGNNPYPIKMEADARCCDECNILKVIPARDPSVSVDFLVNYYKIVCYWRNLYNGRY